MAYRLVMIESEARLSLKLNNLIIDKGEGEIWIPLGDISMIVIDNNLITITARMLIALAENNIGVLVCDNKHLPIGFYSSFDNHSRISKTIGFQIDKSREYYDSLWMEIVEAKIINQKKVLELLGMNREAIIKMNEFTKEIEHGDMTNREAHAAKVYFNTLMGQSFSRGNEDLVINSGLDYVYAVIRAYIARTCCGYGLITQLGIHHKSEYNRFNLADDLIEPFRPIADYYVYQLMKEEKFFLPEHRRRLVNFLNHKIVFNSKVMYLSNVIEEFVSQYAAYLSSRRDNIIYPDVFGYVGEEYEEQTEELDGEV